MNSESCGMKMSYIPPFKITPKILNLVSSISERVGEFNRDILEKSPELRKKNRIKTITGTLAIEGNTLSEEQITAIVEGKQVLGTALELAEVQGAIKAYESLSELDPYKIEDMLKAHRLMMGDILSEAGKFRKKSVGIHKGGEVVHVAPQAHRVSGLMGDLFNWLKEAEDHSLILSSVFHYEFEFIHPFSDGNGRMGRLWQTLLLSTWNPIFLSLPLESVIKEHQEGYYRSLEVSDENSDCTQFISFMLEAIRDTLDKNAPANVPANVPANIEAMKTKDAVFEIIKSNEKITRKEIADILGKDIRTIGRNIRKLQEEGKLKRVGSDKTGYWSVIV